jgi:hypothetical protein
MHTDFLRVDSRLGRNRIVGAGRVSYGGGGEGGE